MSGLKYCRICLDVDVRMFQISGSEVQNVYEKLTNKKVQEDGTLYYACFICHRHLQNCHQLVVKSQKWDELSKELLINSKLDPQPIPNVTRLTYGLVHSLTNSDTESFHTQGCDGIIKTEIKSECEADGVVVKHEPDDGASPDEKPKVDEKYIVFEIDEANSIRSQMLENISVSDTNIVTNETNSSQIAHDERSRQTLAENDEKEFVRNDCDKTYDTKAPFVGHFSGQDPVVTEPIIYIETNSSTINIIENFKCQYCGFTCRDNHSLKRHNCRTHTRKNLLKCEYCNYTCVKNSTFKMHIRTHTREKPYTCQYCDYKCARNDYLTRHLKIHTREMSYKCQYCDYTCSENGYLNRHLRTHTGEKPFKCQYCNYTCAQSGCLTDHIRTHTGEKPFKCQYCDYTCTRKCNLKKHLGIHSREKPYKCQFCDYKCIESGHLKRHLRTHTGEKPFECQYCDYKFAQSGCLANHIKTHTKEKPYKCQYCDYKCARNDYLNKHIKTHTGEKPYKCQYCDYTCANNGMLNRHVKTHTGENPLRACVATSM